MQIIKRNRETTYFLSTRDTIKKRLGWGLVSLTISLRATCTSTFHQPTHDVLVYGTECSLVFYRQRVRHPVEQVVSISEEVLVLFHEIATRSPDEALV